MPLVWPAGSTRVSTSPPEVNNTIHKAYVEAEPTLQFQREHPAAAFLQEVGADEAAAAPAPMAAGMVFGKALVEVAAIGIGQGGAAVDLVLEAKRDRRQGLDCFGAKENRTRQQPSAESSARQWPRNSRCSGLVASWTG